MTPRIEVIYKIHDAWRASLEQELKTARATLQGNAGPRGRRHCRVERAPRRRSPA